MGRGGKREGSGRKKKPLADRLLEGNPSRRPVKVLEFEASEDGVIFPEAPDFLDTVTKKVDGVPTAKELHNQIVKWLDKTGCLDLIDPILIEDLAINRANWLECEALNIKHGRIIKGPDGVSVKKSPYVEMALNYHLACGRAWDKIWAVVSQNSERDYRGGGTSNDIMEQLLSGKG